MNASFITNPVCLSCGDEFERLKKKGHNSCLACDQKTSSEQVKAYSLPQSDQKINQTSQHRFAQNSSNLQSSFAIIPSPQVFPQLPSLIEQKDIDPSNRIRECLVLIPSQFDGTLENLESFKKQKINLLIQEMDSKELYQFLVIVISNLNIDKFCSYLNWMLIHLGTENRKKICQSLMGINFVPSYSLARQLTATMFEIFFAQYDPLLIEMNEIEIDFFNYIINVARPLERFNFCSVFANKYSLEELDRFAEHIIPQLEIENMDKLDQALITYKETIKSEILQEKLEKMHQEIVRLRADKIQLQNINIKDRKNNRIWLFGAVAVAIAVAGVAYYYFAKNGALSATLDEKTNALMIQDAVVETFVEALEKSNDTIDAMAKQLEQSALQVDVLSQHLEEKSSIVNELTKKLAKQSAQLQYFTKAESKQGVINTIENVKCLTPYLPWISTAIEVVKFGTIIL